MKELKFHLWIHQMVLIALKKWHKIDDNEVITISLDNQNTYQG